MIKSLLNPFKRMKLRIREKITEEKRFYSTKKQEIKEREEEIKQENDKDKKIINDENAFPEDKGAAEARVAQRNEELARLQTQIA